MRGGSTEFLVRIRIRITVRQLKIRSVSRRIIDDSSESGLLLYSELQPVQYSCIIAIMYIKLVVRVLRVLVVRVLVLDTVFSPRGFGLKKYNGVLWRPMGNSLFNCLDSSARALA